jgi:GntR family transcriptional regulator, transcriptional repressor for pyruvate dehydrogenase complex
MPTAFHPVTTLRTFEEAIEQIAYAVRVGDLTVGERLPPERILAATMEISRPTLREAVQLLVRAGVLRVDPGPAGGMFVIADTIPPELLQARVKLRITEVAAVLEARRVFEPQTAQLAGLFATETDFRRMRATIDAQLESLGARERLNQLDERFHLYIARATGNPTVVELMQTLLRKLAIAWDIGKRLPHDDEAGIAMHEHTLQALMSRDPQAIDTAMDEHLGLLEHLWEHETGRPRLRHRHLTYPTVSSIHYQKRDDIPQRSHHPKYT